MAVSSSYKVGPLSFFLLLLLYYYYIFLFPAFHIYLINVNILLNILFSLFLSETKCTHGGIEKMLYNFLCLLVHTIMDFTLDVTPAQYGENILIFFPHLILMKELANDQKE